MRVVLQSQDVVEAFVYLVDEGGGKRPKNKKSAWGLSSFRSILTAGMATARIHTRYSPM